MQVERIQKKLPEDARGAAPPRTPQGNALFTVEVGFQASPSPTQCVKGKDLICIPKHPHYAPLASVVDASAVLIRRRGLIIGKRSRCRCCH